MRLLLAIAGCLFVWSSISAEDPRPPAPAEADVLKTYQQVVSLGAFRTKFPAYATAVSLPKVKGLRKAATIWVVDVRGPVAMEFELPTMRLHFAYNDALDRYLATLPKDRERKPQWTAEQAVADAKRHVEMFEQPDWGRLQLAPGSPFFKSQGVEAGTWYVDWDRVVKEYRYPGDGIIVNLHEEFGLWSYASEMHSVEVSTEVAVTQDEAVRIANDALPSGRDKWRRHLPGGKLKLHNALLQIVHPNWIFSDVVPPDDPHKFLYNTDARLAWVLEYAPTEETGAPKVWLWVDARSGEVLGGDWEKGI